MNKILAGLLIGAMLGLPATGPAFAQITGPRDQSIEGTQPDADADEEGEEEATGSFKICSAVAPSGFRDTIPVPESWTVQDCQQWVASFGGQAQVGCIFSSGTPKFSWAPFGKAGAVPSPDCGWGQDAEPPAERPR